MTDPLISIIVPVYKTEQYLPQCIESILAQTYKNLEIILIDDGSPDNCGAICDKYAAQDKRIVVIHKDNGGVSSARNAGLKIAKGEYIGFVDSDDYIAPDMYEYLYGLIRCTNADVAVCSLYKGNNQIVERLINDNVIQVPSNEVFNLPYFPSLWNKLLIRKKTKNIWFVEKATYCEDGYFLFNVLQNTKNAIVSNKPKYYYRTNDCSATRSFKITHLYVFEMCKQFISFAKQNHLIPFYMYAYNLRLICMSAWMGWLALEENPDRESVQILQSHCRQNLWRLLTHKEIKFTKKCFLIVACINFNVASKLAKKLYSRKNS